MTLNEMQAKIATTLEGMVLVDAGPGTGKTHTMVERYANIFNKPEVDPHDILLMTFTNNAAAEMKERLEERMAGNEEKAFIQASTFDSFCLQVVLDSPEAVTGFFGMKEKLTRSAGLSENETMNAQHFYDFYAKFVKNKGHLYKNAPALTSKYVPNLYKLIKKLMSRGIMPLDNYEWFGARGDILKGDAAAFFKELKRKNGAKMLKKVLDKMEDDELPTRGLDATMEFIPEDILKNVADEPRTELIWLVHDIYYEYIRYSISHNRLTFGLTALFALAVLYSDQSARKRFSYRYVMIDEFQDTNELQLKIAMLIMKESNLCVVGDWKQGIYGFRNASIENITDFDRRIRAIKETLNREKRCITIGIPEVISYSLVENYRSSQLVIDHAFHTLTIKGTANEEGFDKEAILSKVTKIRQARIDIGEHTDVEFLRTESREEEVKSVLCQIQKYVTDPRYVICDRNGERRPTYRDIAVLCDKGKLCREINVAAAKAGIPAYLQGDVEIMSTREGKIALAWLRFVNNKNDPAGPVAIMTDQGYSLAEMEPMFRKKEGSEAKPLPEDLLVQRKNLYRKKRRLNDLLTSIFDHHGLNNDVTQAIISILSSVHRSSLMTIPDLIRLMEEDIKQSTSYYVDPSLDTEAVTIQTMHKSKGLEYPIVIIAGLNSKSFPNLKDDGSVLRFDDIYGLRSTEEYIEDNGYHTIIPSWNWAVINSIRIKDYSELRRLFFVAISRAKQYVTMTTHRPSTFIKAFGENNIVPGDTNVVKVAVDKTRISANRPDISGYEKRRINISVHDVMNMTEASGRGDESSGKGMEYGTKVHEAAQIMAAGKKPKDDYPELEMIGRILDSVKDSDVLAEIECTLPVDKIMIRGIIDLLAVYPDRVEIHDYKTDVDKKYLDNYRTQLSIYYHAVSKYFGKPTECFIDFVSLGETVKVDPMELERIQELARMAIRT